MREKLTPFFILSFLFSCQPLSHGVGGEELMQQLEPIQKAIHQAHQQADPLGMRNAYDAFITLRYEELQWQQVSQDLGAYKWPSQTTWKQVVGGHLFFLRDVYGYLEPENLQYYLKRGDWLWSFAITTKFSHSLGKFHLVRLLDSIRSDYTGAATPDFFKQLYREAFAELEQSLDHPDACYVLGICYSDYGFKVGISVDPIRALNYLKRGGDYKNQLQALSLRERYRAFEKEMPNFEEYLALARQGYAPAYYKAIMFIGKQDNPSSQEIEKQQQVYLEEMMARGYALAYFTQGRLQKWYRKIDKAIESFKTAGDMGLTFGYLEAIDLVYEREDWSCQTCRNKAFEYYGLATEANDPKAWEDLADSYVGLYTEKLRQTRDTQDHEVIKLRKKAHQVLEEGMKRGVDGCFHTACFANFTSKDWFLTKNREYGPAPQTLGMQDLMKTLLLETPDNVPLSQVFQEFWSKPNNA